MNTTETKIDWEKELIELVGYTDHEKAFLLWLIESETVDLQAYEDVKQSQAQSKIINDLARDLNIEKNEYHPNGYSHDQIEGEYQILTDDEADAAWDESLDSYIEECVLPEIPETYRYYFDDESWKCDAKMDGRGHSLNHYDGEEHEVKFNGEYYYIYRTN